MSRKYKKKRTYCLKPTQAYRHWWFRFNLLRPSLLRALIIPALTLFIYLLMREAGVFSVYYPSRHWAVWTIFALWFFYAIRGAVGYWSHRAHMRFFVPLVLCVAVGSCWVSVDPAPIKVWVTPPPYAQLPSEALTDGFWSEHNGVLEGSQIHVSWEDENSSVDVSFNGKHRTLEFYGIREPVTTFIVPVKANADSYELFAHNKWLRVGRWKFQTKIDKEPKVSLIEDPQITVRKTIRFAYAASDDYGVQNVVARLTPTASSLRETVRSIDIPLRSPSKKKIQTTNYVDLTDLPWAGVPVTVQLIVEDGAGQKGWSAPKILALPSRTFRNPFARALIEERQKLLRQPDAAMRDEAANVMAGIAQQQNLFSGDPVVMMSLRAGAVRLVVNNDPETVKNVGSILWQAAVRLEEGRLGLARLDLAHAEQGLSIALMHKDSEQNVMIYLSRVERALAEYLDVLEKERMKQPVALKEVDWSLAGDDSKLQPEDLKEQLETVQILLKEDAKVKAQAILLSFRQSIENLRTTPPELTSAQAMIARQVSALRALVRSQTQLVTGLEPLANINRKTRKGRKAFKNRLAHQVAQQKLLLSALHEVITQSGLKSMDAKAGELAMIHVIKALKKKKIEDAGQKQIEALALLENSLLSLTEQMRRSLASTAP